MQQKVVPSILKNNAPIANAGADQSVNVGDTVHLDGSQSSDAEGGTLLYSWSIISQPTGSTATLSNETTVNPTFTPNVGGDYTIRLVVNDRQLDSEPDEVTISVNALPVANAGVDQTVTQGESVTLDASGSSDSDGTIVSYEWKEGSTVLSTSSSFSKSDFTVGTHTITLTVTDNDGATASDSVVVTVSGSVLKKTGQTTIYIDFDDGYYQMGVTPSYTRDDVNDTVTDNVTGLMWQDDVTQANMNWSAAQTYCSDLSLGGYTDWRLPTRKELVGLVDYGRFNPAIDPKFHNTAFDSHGYSNYWISTAIANVNLASRAWYVDFKYGDMSVTPKTNNNFVRCVRGED